MARPRKPDPPHVLPTSTERAAGQARVCRFCGREWGSKYWVKKNRACRACSRAQWRGWATGTAGPERHTEPVRLLSGDEIDVSTERDRDLALADAKTDAAIDALIAAKASVTKKPRRPGGSGLVIRRR